MEKIRVTRELNGMEGLEGVEVEGGEGVEVLHGMLDASTSKFVAHGKVEVSELRTIGNQFLNSSIIDHLFVRK